VDGKREPVVVRVGDEVCVPLWAAVIEGKVLETDVGKVVHIAYLGLIKREGGKNDYKEFSVLWPINDMNQSVPDDVPDAWDGPEPVDTSDADEEMPY
ncbi:MAG: hypothetical protein O2992_09670, partial [Gemmatimonadetes bacterium]|nr:hypothetical protein [Gemmatimonadota bacterium]